MKKDKSKKRDDDDGGDDLDAMREAFRKHKARASGAGGGKKDWDKLDAGKNMRRILPRPGEKQFYTEGWTHFNVGPNERAFRCIDEDKINVERGLPESGTKCPLCKKFLREQSRINSEYPKGDEEGRAEWGRAKEKFVPRHQFYTNVLKEDDDGDMVVKILAFGPQIWGSLMNYYLGDDTTIGDFTDLKGGRSMNIKKQKKGGGRRNISYEVFPASESTDISDAWDDIKEAMHDLDAAPGKVLSKDEVIAIMKGEDVDKDGGDDDDDDDTSDSGSRRRKKKSRDDDDEDEEEGDEEEEEEEDDEDEDEPVKTKKSKLAIKMGKKRREDD